jgi:medium-chain acyl-[acyl-carrier-protein] hydrolase
MPELNSPWFVKHRSRPGGVLRLFCFPYAGGGALAYHQWWRELPPEIDVVPVELPGRGHRMREPARRSFPGLISEIEAAISPHLDIDFALFGHSMGATIAFELVRQLRRRGLPQPRLLIVSGRRAPQLPADDPPTYNLPEAEFIAELHKLNGTPKEVLDSQELMSLMLPLLRADFELIQTYQFTPDAPLSCPISAYGGTEDSELPRNRLLPWREQTTGEFSLRMLTGDHFFLRSSQTELLRLISRDLIRVMNSAL